MNLKQSTVQLIEGLSTLEFFSRVGIQESEGVTYVPSWADAIRAFRKEQWYNLGDATRYEMQCVDPDDSNRWSTSFSEITQQIEPIVMRLMNSKKLFGLSDEHRKRISEEVESQMRFACLTEEYSEIRQFRLFPNVIHWVFAGHFACGWDGLFPDGNLIVY
jgi:hypothetical protein